MTDLYITYQGYTLYCKKQGNGSEPLLCFNGFGQKADVYDAFSDSLSERFTLYSFEHFFHGRSYFPPTAEKYPVLSPETWYGLMQTFFRQENISRFSFMAYSLGGKIGFLTLEQFPESVNRIILLAPDGIIESPWYGFVARTWIGGVLYRWLARNASLLFNIMRTIRKLRLVPEKAYKFAESQLNSSEKRELVYQTWRAYAHIQPNLHNVKSIINRRQIPVTLITGKYDVIMNPRLSKKFMKDMHNGCQHIKLATGHDLIRHKNAQAVAQTLQT